MKQKETPPTPTKEQYLEPVNFKGTTGKWYMGENTIQSNNHHGLEIVCNITGWSAQPKEDGKLISQSKELAKALQDMIENFTQKDSAWFHRQMMVHVNAKKVLSEAGLTNE